MKEKAKVAITTDTERRILPAISRKVEDPDEVMKPTDVAASLGQKYMRKVAADSWKKEKVEKAAHIGAAILNRADSSGALAIVNEEEMTAYIYERRSDENYYHKITYHSPVINKIEWDYIDYEELEHV